MTLTFFFSGLGDSSGSAERLSADYAPSLTSDRKLQRDTVECEGGDEMLRGALHLGPPAHEFG
jgi:hypothetical protein